MERGTPFIINCVEYEIKNVPFEFSAESNITVTSFGFADFLEVKEADLYVDDTIIGPLEESLPIALTKGSTFKILIQKSSNKNSKFSDVTTSFYLRYNLEESGEEKVYFDTVHVTGITSQDNFTEFVKYWEKEEKNES